MAEEFIYINALIYALVHLYDFQETCDVCSNTTRQVRLWVYLFKVCKPVHYHTIQINQPTRCKDFSSLLLDVYLQLNMFRASSCPSSGAQQLQ
jgi:hypothetical protein